MGFDQMLTAGLVGRFAGYGSAPTDTDEERLRKGVLVLLGFTAAVLITPLWGTLYLIAGQPRAAAFPYSFVVVAGLGLAYVGRTKKVGYVPLVIAGYNLVVSIGIHVALGGFHPSSAVIVFAVFTPVGLLLFYGRQRMLGWLLLFLVTLVVLGLVDGLLTPADLPDWLVTALYVANIGASCTILFFILLYFTLERDRAQERSETLLLNILPQPVAEQLKRTPGVIADRFESATVLFADVVGFTPLWADHPPEEMVEWLNRLYWRFDELADDYGAEKIKTIGDAYMAVAGVPEPRSDHAVVIAKLALDMRDHFSGLTPIDGHHIECRIGIGSGPLVGGIIGEHKFQYDLWGATVNTASRMESHGVAGRIQISAATFRLLENRFELEPRGTVDVKGLGKMETWFLLGESESVG